MNIVIIADVASALRHTGDEAMFQVALTELSVRGASSFTVIAPSNPPDLQFKHVRVVAPIGFGDQPGSAHDGKREERLEQVLAGAGDDPLISGVREAVAAADAVVIAGGGNLSASWPHHLYERIALLEIAAQHRVPAIVSGQTIGPVFTHRQRERLGHALAGTKFVGLRDLPSLALVRDLGPVRNAALQLDDAITLASGPVDQSLPLQYVALCAHQYGADRSQVANEIARLAVELHHRSELPIVLFPNTAPDAQLGNEVAAIVNQSTIVRIAALSTAATTADGIRRSSAVVSMRFHPLVFGLAGGVPCMAIASDQYTQIKLQGVMHHAGLASWQAPSDAFVTPIVAELFGELWARRAEISTHLLATVPDWFDRHHQRWDAVWSAIKGDSTAVSTLVAQPSPGVAELHPLLQAANWASKLAVAGRERLALADQRFDGAEESAYSLHALVKSRDAEIEGWRTHAADLERRLNDTFFTPGP